LKRLKPLLYPDKILQILIRLDIFQPYREMIGIWLFPARPRLLFNMLGRVGFRAENQEKMRARLYRPYNGAGIIIRRMISRGRYPAFSIPRFSKISHKLRAKLRITGRND